MVKEGERVKERRGGISGISVCRGEEKVLSERTNQGMGVVFLFIREKYSLNLDNEDKWI